MKSKNIFFYSIIFFGLSLFSIDVVSTSLLDMHIYQIFAIQKKTEKQIISRSDSSCSAKPPLDLSSTSDPQLTKLAAYQAACGSFVTDQMMIFTNMPKDNTVAKKNGEEMAETLKDFSSHGVRPIVIAEPVTDWGLIDYEEFKTGFYDQWIDTYFATIKNSGISDEEMGTWIPFPEPNLPYWNHANAKPQDFSAIVNQYLASFKKHFPTAKASVMLNSATYENDDFDWRNGEYVSLLPYVEGLNKSYIDSFGLQGFPWSPPADESGVAINQAAEFLPIRLITEAAQSLGVNKVWLNTGTFGLKYTDDNKRTVFVSPGKRQAVLSSIVDVATRLKNSHYEVSINLFAEDKSSTTEATDWSYKVDPAATQENTSSEESIVFSNFVTTLMKNNIGFSLYDSAH